MSDPVVKALLLDKIPIDGKVVLINQYNDGSPFVHSILAHCARQRRKICLIAFSESSGYYHSVGSRLGWNLNNLLSKNEAVFVGGLSALKESFQSSNPANPLDFVLHSCSSTPLEALLAAIRHTVSNWLDQPFSLVIDRLDSLFCMGIEFKDIIYFFQQCQALIQKHPKGSLIVSVGVTPNDTEIVQFTSLLAHWSELVLTEKGLQMGKSKDLSGSLAVNWTIAPKSEQHFHFKCFDRGIRMFAPGTAIL